MRNWIFPSDISCGFNAWNRGFGAAAEGATAEDGGGPFASVSIAADEAGSSIIDWIRYKQEIIRVRVFSLALRRREKSSFLGFWGRERIFRKALGRSKLVTARRTIRVPGQNLLWERKKMSEAINSTVQIDLYCIFFFF